MSDSEISSITQTLLAPAPASGAPPSPKCVSEFSFTTPLLSRAHSVPTRTPDDILFDVQSPARLARFRFIHSD